MTNLANLVVAKFSKLVIVTEYKQVTLHHLKLSIKLWYISLYNSSSGYFLKILYQSGKSGSHVFPPQCSEGDVTFSW